MRHLIYGAVRGGWRKWHFVILQFNKNFTLTGDVFDVW